MDESQALNCKGLCSRKIKVTRDRKTQVTDSVLCFQSFSLHGSDSLMCTEQKIAHGQNYLQRSLPRCLCNTNAASMCPPTDLCPSSWTPCHAGWHVGAMWRIQYLPFNLSIVFSLVGSWTSQQHTELATAGLITKSHSYGRLPSCSDGHVHGSHHLHFISVILVYSYLRLNNINMGAYYFQIYFICILLSWTLRENPSLSFKWHGCGCCILLLKQASGGRHKQVKRN